MKKIVSLSMLLAAVSIASAACGSSSSPTTGAGRFPPAPGFERTGDGDDDDDDGSTGTPSETPVDSTPTPEPTISPEPTPTPPPDECVPTAGDLDCDGIPDVVDNIPCESFVLLISNEGVSSAEILLNGDVVATSSDFPTTAVIERKINPVSGMNSLAVGGKLTGSPGDVLRFQIVDGEGLGYLDQTVTRQPGPASAIELAFEVDVTCQ